MPYEAMPVRPIRVTYRCDECGEGEMVNPKPDWSSSPFQVLHSCSNCGAEKTFTEMLPTIRYVKEGELLTMDPYEPEVVELPEALKT